MFEQLLRVAKGHLRVSGATGKFYRSGNVSPGPLLVYLHGAGEIGGDTESQVRKSGPWADVLFRPSGPYSSEAIARISQFHVVGFHLSKGDWNPGLLNQAIEDHIQAHPSIDPLRLCITGISRGGRGALKLASHRIRNGQAVSAVAAFCPEGSAQAFNSDEIDALRRTSVYLFHCPEDDVVSFDGTAVLHRRIGSGVSRLRIIHVSELANRDSPHVCWTEVYANPDLYMWFTHRANDPADWPQMQLRVQS
jgi:predicted peptidase